MLFSFNTVFTAVVAMAPLAQSAIMPEMSIDERSLVKRQMLSGQATTYGGNTAGGACSFTSYTLPSGLYGTALSDSNWDDSAQCGGCVAVTGPSGQTITAMITDECPGCGTNHLDLYPDAFQKVTGDLSGIYSVKWQYVPCPTKVVGGPLEIHMKSGVSEYWFSAQVVNAIRRTSKLEVSTDNGNTWKSTTRQTYNYFEISGGVGAQTAWIRVTSHVGTVVVVKDVPMNSGAVVKAGSNYS